MVWNRLISETPTGSISKEERDKIMSSGMEYFIGLPYRTRQLFDCIVRVLGVRFSHEEDQTAAISVEQKMVLRPEAQSPEPQNTCSQKSIRKESPTNPKGIILVVDDNQNNLQLLTHILKMEGYQVRSVDSGESALASVASDPPELILLDILMPVMDGFEVLRRLKAQKESREIPVIFLSAFTEVEQKVEGLKLGAVDFVSKPFQREELLARVSTHLELFKLRARLELQAADLRRTNEQLQVEINERIRQEEKLKYLAIHDALTGLLNRHSLEEMLVRTIARAKRGVVSSLLYMDLDNFKEVNDTVGHAAGDEVLNVLSGILRELLRIEDVIFRLGGDEFAVLLEGMEERESFLLAERLRKAVEAHSFESEGRVFQLSLSIGLITINGTLETGALLSKADAAMYSAKKQGKNRVVVT